MINDSAASRSVVACVDKEDGAVFRLGSAQRIIGPNIVDSTHVMVGVGCGDWGLGVYLTLADAIRLNNDLSRLLAEVEVPA